MKLRSPHSQFIGIFLLTLLLYWRTFSVPFLSDDYNLLTGWVTILNPSSGNRWLPLQGILYGISHRLFGLSALPLHILFFAIFLGFLAVYVRLIEFFSGSRRFALLSAVLLLFFYRMPMVLYWLPSAIEILAAFFGLGSILTFLLYWKNRERSLLALSVSLFALSLLSKESAILVFVSLLLWFGIYIRKKKRTILRFARSLLPFVIVVGAYGVLLFATASSERAGLFVRGGYSLLPLPKMLTQFANILLGILPIRIDNPLLSGTFVSWYVVGGEFILLVYLLANRKLPNALRFWGCWLLLGTLPYGLFSPYPFQDKYLFWSALGLQPLLLVLGSFLLASLHFLPVKARLGFGWLLLGIWLIFSWTLFQYRARQWQGAGQTMTKILQQLHSIGPSIPPGSFIIAVDFPPGPNQQVFLLNNGLPSVFNLVARGLAHHIETINNVEPLTKLLEGKTEDKGDSLHRLFFYSNGTIRDLSGSYSETEELLRRNIQPATLSGRFLERDRWNQGKKSDASSLEIATGESTVTFNYKLARDDWVYGLLSDSPILKETKRIALEVRGYGKGEKLYIDLFDRDTDSFNRVMKTVDWDGWLRLDLPLDAFTQEGKKPMELNEVDSFKLSVESDRPLDGQLEFRGYAQESTD